MSEIHVCRFDSTLGLKKPTYEAVKARVLEAGRYSCFEASANARLMGIFARLERDPELVCTTAGFPWTRVERKKPMKQVCGHVPADPTKDQTVCEKCGKKIIIHPETHLWREDVAAPVASVCLKAAWEVRAGLIPGQPMPEYTKRFLHTSEDCEEDGRHAKEFAYHPIFMKRMAEAASYHQQVSNPQALNWAELTFIWY